VVVETLDHCAVPNSSDAAPFQIPVAASSWQRHDGGVSDSIVPAADTHLIDGWEAETPHSDTLVRMAAHVHASWPTAVAGAVGRPWRATERWAGGFIADRGALSNPIILLQPPADPAAVLEEIGALVPATSPYLLLSPWPAPDLSQHGLALLGHPPLMVRFPSAGTVPSPAGVEVREVNDADELAVAERVLVEGYPMPDLEPFASGDLLGPRILDGQTRVWLAYVDGRPSAVAACHRHAGATLVEYVATLSAARGRGAGAAVTWAATLAHPEDPAVLVASDDGRPVYEAMGYVAIERWTAWLRPAD
jgi:hypothetical protein